MPLAVLEFTLPEERQELDRCLAADEMISALYEIRQHLRSRLKYADLTKEAQEELEAVKALLPFELMERV